MEKREWTAEGYDGRGPLGTSDRTWAGDIATVFARAFELAMQIERERFLRAGPYERTAERQGYANGYKPKRIDTPAGTVTVDVPKTAGHDGAPFYPQSLERGRRSVRAVMLAVAEMYIKGVSTREVEAVMREFGIESLSSSQVSRAAKLLDDELEAWRNRPSGRDPVPDSSMPVTRRCATAGSSATSPCSRRSASARTSAAGCSASRSPCPRRRSTGGPFLESLQARGLRGVEYVVSDDHAGLRAARRAVLRRREWQRCQFHLAQNAIHHAPSLAIRKRIGAELRAVWNAGSSLAKAETALAELVAAYRDTARNLPHGWKKRARRARCLCTARTPPPPHAHLQPDGARRAAGAQAPHRQGPGLPQRGRARTPRQRRAGRDRRQMGRRHQGLHQMGMPGCVITPI
jgi:putative transposase